MTVQEVKCQQCTNKCPQEKLASDIAKGRMYATNEFIQCQKELEQYRTLGTVEELKEAREKQIPVEHHHTRVDNITDKVRKSVCPICLGIIYTYREEYPNYCTNCGQAIDWEEGNTNANT